MKLIDIDGRAEVYIGDYVVVTRTKIPTSIWDLDFLSWTQSSCFCFQVKRLCGKTSYRCNIKKTFYNDVIWNVDTHRLKLVQLNEEERTIVELLNNANI